MWDNHAQMVKDLVKPGREILAMLSPNQAHLWHMATGISGEAGELIDAIKKYVVYGAPLDIDNVIEELGDLEFYMEGLRFRLGITREATLQANMRKLAIRYSEGYNDEAAVERTDKEEG